MSSTGGLTREQALRVVDRAIETWARADLRGDYPPLVGELEELTQSALKQYAFVIYREIDAREGEQLRAEKARWVEGDDSI